MWPHLRLTVIHAEFQAEGPCRLPPYKGTTLRGALGYALKELACFRRPQPCRDCLCPDRCAYGGLYEALEGRDDPSIPKPYVLTPPTDRRENFRSGDRLKVVMSLIGSARVWLPWVVEALDLVGERGLGFGKRPWILKSLHVESFPGTFDEVSIRGGINRLRVAELDGTALVAAKPYHAEATLRFLTPVDIRIKHERVPPIGGETVICRLVRRVGSLLEHYCNWSKGDFDFGALIADATLVRCTADRLRVSTWERYSTDTATRHPLSGYVGEVEWTEIPPSLWPYLVIGEWLHLGKGASFGMGKYVLDPAVASTAMETGPSSRLGLSIKDRIATRRTSGA